MPVEVAAVEVEVVEVLLVVEVVEVEVEVLVVVLVAGTVEVERVVLVAGWPSVGITTRVTLMHSRLTSTTGEMGCQFGHVGVRDKVVGRDIRVLPGG